MNELKYQVLIQKREVVGLKPLHDTKAFIENSQYMDDCNNINDYNLNRNQKNLIVFDDIIADIMTDKKL